MHHITNTLAERQNLKIATVQKMAYRYSNKEHLKAAINFQSGNFDMSF